MFERWKDLLAGAPDPRSDPDELERLMSGALRIGIVCPYSLTYPGGVQNQVLGLARLLGQMGHKVRVLAPCDGPPPEPGITPLGASITTDANGSVVPLAPDPSCALRLLRALRDEQFDVLHVHEPNVPGVSTNAMIYNTTPVVGTWHAAGGSLAYMIPGVRVLANRVKVRVAVSKDAEKMAMEALGGEYTRLWNGVEMARYREGQASPTDGPTIVFVGRHEPRKGLSVLLDAMEHIPHHVRLWVVGLGPETETMKAKARHDHRITWLGSVDDVELVRRLRGADVFCVPSLRGESFGVVLLEGMAAGTAVVASDLPGYRNVVIDGDEARLVAPGDPVALAEALMEVLTDDDTRKALVERGQLRA
ncbi:MAG: glycosyltransferase family 4 protein, partial [Actinobacteria bacterium]|nr:glycosyltransferase family 4 protein [Actinomycetota bacterium]